MKELLRIPQVSASVVEDETATDGLHKRLAKALVVSLPDLSEFITALADAFKTALPNSWPVARIDEDIAVASSTSLGPTTPLHEFDLCSSIAALDLVAYTFSCGRTPPAVGSESCRARVYYGLEGLAHPCPLSGVNEAKFNPLPTYHRAVLRILTLLKLDPASTTVVMLDSLDPAFVDSSSLNGASQYKTYKLLTWRQAVRRVTTFCFSC